MVSKMLSYDSLMLYNLEYSGIHHQQWRSTIPPILTTASLSPHIIKYKKNEHNLYLTKSYFLACDRYISVAGCITNQRDSNPAFLDNWISNGNTEIKAIEKTGQIRFHSKRSHTKMNDIIVIDSRIAGSMNDIIVIDSRIAGSMNDIFYCLFVVYYRDYMTVCPIIFTHHNT